MILFEYLNPRSRLFEALVQFLYYRRFFEHFALISVLVIVGDSLSQFAMVTSGLPDTLQLV